LPALAAACLAAAAVFPSPSGGATGPWAETPESRVRLLSGLEAAPPAGTETALDLGVEIRLAPHWHAYWRNSGDAGYAPKLDLTATPGASKAELLFPAPLRFDLPGGLVSFGYENEVIYPVAATIRREAGGPLAIRGRLDYLVCATECIPYTADLALDLPAETEADPSAASGDDAARLAAWRKRLPRAAGSPGAPAVALALERGHPESTLVVTASGPGFRASSPDLFFDSHERFALGKPAMTIGGDGLTFRVPVRPLDETKPWPAASDFAWTLTGLEGSDGPFALAGTNAVAIPSPVSSLRRFWFVALLALPLLALLVLRLRRSRPDDAIRTQPA
jgi:DsbC/DsbD-like thiol-disulfide interchange protein